MEKRLVTFLILSVLILTGHVLIRNMVAPPQPQVARQDTPDDPTGDPAQNGDASEQIERPEQPQADERDAHEATAPGEAAEDVDPDKPPLRASKEPAAPAVPHQWFTLGSFDPNEGYLLLVTFSNWGAAVERVELVERNDKGRLRFRDLIRTYGYLGLHGHTTRQGCVVRVVGPGTPADLATQSDRDLADGFQAGDVIDAVNGLGITNHADLDAFLADTKPGDNVAFDVRRGGNKISLTATLENWPLQLVQPETPVTSDSEFMTAGNALLVPPEATHDEPMVPSYLLGLDRVGSLARLRGQDEIEGIASLRRSTWKVAQPSEYEIVFSQRVQLPEKLGGGELECVKRFRIPTPVNDEADGNLVFQAPDETGAPNPFAGYSLQMDIEIHNHGTNTQSVSYVMDGPNGLPSEGWWYTNKIHPSWGAAGARDVAWRVNGNKHSLRSATQIYKQCRDASGDVDRGIVSILTDNPTLADRTLDYLGVDTQYFAAVLLAGTAPARQSLTCQQAYSMPIGEPDELTGRGMKQLNTSYRLVTVSSSIEPGASVTDQYQLFLGPKETEVLRSQNLPDLIEYGWFGRIARPLSWLLHVFYGIFRNYGVAIIVLTVLVRGAMFPLGRKAARQAQVMQELAPEIKKIKEKYKNDLEKQGQAQRQLWKKHNFNPLSSCWLMLLQLPIFIGLYRCLSVDIHLRQAPLIPGIHWCSNLAGPDMAWRWQGIVPDFFASETGWLGPYLNILPIFTVILFIVQQKMFTPPATDDQTRMQQNMMKYMMIFIGVLFFKVPAGLCVYFIASSLWGIGERKLLPKPGSESSAAKDQPVTKNSSNSGKKSWLQRVREKSVDEAAEAARRRRKRRK